MKNKREPITPTEAKRNLRALDVMSGKIPEPANRAKTEPRRFIVEYTDGQGREYSKESVSASEPTADNYTVWTEIINEYKPQGYEVMAITELLHGYDSSEVEAMRAVNPSNALKHIRIIYLKSQRKGRRRK